MRNIVIPQTVEAYQADIMAHALPEPLITDNDFYRRLIGWVVDHRTPLLYEQDHGSEYTNLSINFNWLMLRDYTDSPLGPQGTMHSMYALHEFAHMTHWLPTRLDELTAGEYAEQFNRSEYRASNETELLIHYRIPELRSIVLPGVRIAFDVLREKGVEQPAMASLCRLRPLLVEDTVLDGFFADDPDIAARFKRFSGNREWARARFDAIRPCFQDPNLPQGSGLTDAEYEDVISTYEPRLTQERYEANVIRNVRLGYAMCGLASPEIRSFQEAREAAQRLEGQHAIVQS